MPLANENGAHQRRTQANGHALLQLTHLASQRRLGLLKVDLGRQGLARALGKGVDQDRGLLLVEAAFGARPPRGPERVERQRHALIPSPQPAAATMCTAVATVPPAFPNSAMSVLSAPGKDRHRPDQAGRRDRKPPLGGVV